MILGRSFKVLFAYVFTLSSALLCACPVYAQSYNITASAIRDGASEEAERLTKKYLSQAKDAEAAERPKQQQDYLRRAYRTAAELPLDHKIRIHSKQALRRYYRLHRQVDDLQKLDRDWIAALTREHGENDLSLLPSLLMLSDSFLKQRQTRKAEATLKRIITIAELNQKLEHSDAIAALNSLAAISSYAGKSSKAQAYQQQALSLLELTPNASQLAKIEMLNTLATAQLQTKQYSSSKDSFLRALEILDDERYHGTVTHRMVLKNYLQLLQAVGENTEALVIRAKLTSFGLGTPSADLDTSVTGISYSEGGGTESLDDSIMASLALIDQSSEMLPPPLDRCVISYVDVSPLVSQAKKIPDKAERYNAQGGSLSCLGTLMEKIVDQCEKEIYASKSSSKSKNNTPPSLQYDGCIIRRWTTMLSDSNEIIGDSYYLDHSCAPAVGDNSSLSDACRASSSTALVTPISLLWNSQTELEENISYVTFPLEQGRLGHWYEWKASGDAPLLVYDPSHRGNITSAAQLFGSWTFGGKRIASLNTLGAVGADVEWKNGFEALATLDADGDGVITGRELEPLSLWFDRDKDGVSSPGEVIPISRTGVVNLYYTPDKEDKSTKSLYATLGYERMVNGKRITGSAVDWYAEGDKSRTLLVRKHLARAQLCHSPLTKSDASRNKIAQVNLLIPEVHTPPTYKVNPSSNNVSGVWFWKIEDKKYSEKNVPEGVLTISDSGDGTLFGHSFIESSFEPGYSIKSKIGVFVINGKKVTDKNGNTTLLFKTTNPTGMVTDNIARVIDNGKWKYLRGKSVTRTKNGEKEITFSYQWKAFLRSHAE